MANSPENSGDSTAQDGTGHNLPEYSVGEISQALKRTLEESFPRVRVRGELSGFKRATSGHLYFKLKDDEAVLDGICWRGTAGRLSITPEDGMEVIATGRVTSYAGRSSYQIVVESMELAGEGALLKLLEDRKRKLAEEGLFDAERKQKLPYLPEIIGVVSSPTGAVIRDILHRLQDRFSSRVILWPVVVQGEAAPQQIAAAINGFNAIGDGSSVPRPDVLIVARGGGSLEDLMAFNEEIVVRAAASSEIPLISAVGHETDTTLIDFAADVRVPTPTAAAEIAVPVRAELQALVMDSGTRLMRAINRNLNEGRSHLQGVARGLPNLRRLIEEVTQRLDDWDGRLKYSLRTGLQSRRARLERTVAALPGPLARIEHARTRLNGEERALITVGKRQIEQRQQRLTQASSLLESYSYQRVLERGFALVSGPDGQPVLSSKKVNPGDDLNINFHDGSVAATARGAWKGAPSGPLSGTPKVKIARRKKISDDKQGNLL